MGLAPDVSQAIQRLEAIDGLHIISTLRKFYKSQHGTLLARDGVQYVD